MTSPSEIGDGIETRLKTISGLRVIPNDTKITPPTAVVALPSVDYRQAMGRGVTTLDFRVLIFVSQTVTRVGQRALMDYAAVTGTDSIPAAIWADRTLGLSNVDAYVSSFEPFGIEEINAYAFYGGAFTVPVALTGLT